MIIHEQEITWATHKLILTNKKAIYWPAQRTLILSDVHLGKAAHFRRNGIPIPSKIHQKDLDILEILLNHYTVYKVIVVGDLIHANANGEVLDFKNFLYKFQTIEFVLIKGNHDRIADRKILDLGFRSVCDELHIEGITFVHEPDKSAKFQISGHIHPGVTVKLPTNKYFRLPAYVVSEDMIILPAFSQFTGLDTKQVFEKAVNYAVLDTGIIVVK
ncbi:ligase-associated DNA damage response endonuclease PdeM [Sphingobacterium bovistauri]|uniref:Ligase-associated DNA damage response endonuclease PdeM n=1 Tax=Sphingobacterium bovistauri TaxID=2781959 RepID=A0ABS7Z3Y8_9SPHI|nr:ligase-associated DNA damage response endonuclease PdeM [Sphingobacterium bovistauri]MCA5003684.1 ligase-associated DNA damage response endonuclease PdeM [Sphingobacterium bovistauri]